MLRKKVICTLKLVFAGYQINELTNSAGGFQKRKITPGFERVKMDENLYKSNQ